MGICRCKENKPCSVHFFRSSTYPEKYEADVKAFMKSKVSTKGARVPEFETVNKVKAKKEDKLKKLDPCDCSNCDCDDHGDCDCEDCECIVCDC